jgi:phosphatidylglycerophosphate synthase
MAKKLPNMLSIVRIVLSLILIIYMEKPIVFVVVYIAIGLSDVLDGAIARRLGCESELGARLDSIGDFVFYSILVYVFFYLYSSILEVTHIFAIIAIISTRLMNISLTKLKYKKVIFIHTFANKAAGVMVYFMPVVLIFIQKSILVWSVLLIAFIAAVEEMFITFIYDDFDLNRRSVFFK